ncbi:MAG: hypothetical protein HKN38_06110 [Altererythrobacter sp.]|nr:hypothetical protein [Altererythrobacter sp.]
MTELITMLRKNQAEIERLAEDIDEENTAYYLRHIARKFDEQIHMIEQGLVG